ncbi:molybdenum cofactor guanylyltransferase MobA [Paracoccus sp. SCSIO 75233]|uniref:molybdenum cofactor guanylyltransferase MobA n=1 Tax=Paracoccus sp. SCSIO 75233 TaxID=3017782 RepID=UPI0022F04180|nr:molybdenum cofactor guanylyltransferase MobA [Paracoccus sp. SCSIO 75233]WBU52017.1 molybdenum cofactor guanylyltransferase MobA [Paracoccus sp. SCSIO 75233]
MAPARPPAVILAGGQARRMGGGDKCLLEIGGRPVLSHLIARLSPQAAALAINANGDPARFAGFGLPVLADEMPDRPGPLAGILAAMEWAASQGADTVVTVAGDTPFPPLDLVARLEAAARNGLALAAAQDEAGAMRLHPTTAIWPVGLRGDLRTALGAGERRVRGFAAMQGYGVAEFAAGDGFLNINTPEDLWHARNLGPEP